MPLNERDRIEILMMIGCWRQNADSTRGVKQNERKYRELGHVRDAPRQGRPKINENVQQDVILSALENPHCTVRQVSRDLNIGKSSVSNIFKRVRLIHELAEDDFDRRTEFCGQLIGKTPLLVSGKSHWMQEYHTNIHKVNVWAGINMHGKEIANLTEYHMQDIPFKTTRPSGNFYQLCLF
ncbi:hypothetical protein NQ318_012111 [Aromia moschata]|uniref:Transposase n=1 Tax=Aromia moschata TaxID=1265417 RepID=A0AAV8YQW2_9CUCU|nr:hypothetical protein NQ318_012111 [Aromia moschata]